MKTATAIAAVQSPTQTVRIDSVELGFHGSSVLRYLAEKYPRLQKVIHEQIQNALDADATQIYVHVDLQTRTLEISDNGFGATQEQMMESFSKLGKTQKSSEKYGRFGIGVVSAYDKGECFTFTSCAKDREKEGYLTWTFDAKKIEGLEKVPITCEKDESLVYWPDPNQALPIKWRSKNRVPWRTKVKVVGLRRDKRMCQIDMPRLTSEIQSSFGIKMNKLGTVVKVRFTNEKGESTRVLDVKAEAYTGKPLDVEKIEEPDAGTVIFRLYLARQIGGKRGGRVNISVIGNPYRIDARDVLAYATSVLPPLVDKQLATDLCSGIFEGDIECEKLDLKPERDGFKDDDKFFGFCIALDQWYKKVGSRCVLEINNSAQDHRFQQTGLKAMSYIEDLCREQKFKELLSYLSTGTIGKGHTPSQTIGETSPAMSTDGGPLGTKKKVLKGITHKPGKERRDHTPGTVTGPKGSPRRQVKGHSVGLVFAYAQLYAEEVYEFDFDTGVLTFNYSHRFWADCERSDECLSAYQASVAQMVLVLLPYAEMTTFDVQRDILMELLELQVHQIIAGDAFFTERKFKKKSV